MLSLKDIDGIVLGGGIVVDPSGERIGSVEQFFTSGETGVPVFVTVRTGLFGMSESFVPLEGARLDGSVITAAFTKEMVRKGPRLDSDRGTITDTQERELYGYFGLDSTLTRTASSPDSSGDVTAAADSGEEARNAGGAPTKRPMATEPRPPSAGPPPPPPHLHRHVPAPPHPEGPHPRPRPPLPDPAGPHPAPPPGRRPPAAPSPHRP